MNTYIKWFLTIGVLGWAAVTLTARAQDQNIFDSRWYIAPQYSYIWPDSNENTNNGSGWQLDFGKPLSEDWNLEFGVINYDLNFNNGVPDSFHQTEYGLNGLWFFNDRPKVFAPFLLLGAGFGHQSQRLAPGTPGGCTPPPVITCTIGTGPIAIASSETQTYGTLGLGFLTSPWDWSGALRFSAQELHTFGNGNFNDVIASIGLQIPLGATPEAAPPPPPPVPAPAPQPAPPPAPAPAAAPPPPAPAPAPAPTPAPQKIISLPGVEFALNSAHLLPVSQTTLNDAVQTLKDNPGIDAEVAGYTDSTG
ncbi:MAG: hypothetical protein KGL98_10280, partial [Gammaproteobacteria bacterium]|nr:hypothetical protein [Gammaproteobacteria bacterium]MDE2461621.1 hypothetical protein [Gammaproteobacteria bacterium]